MKPTYSIRKLIASIFVVLNLTACQNEEPHLKDQVTIYVDKWGISHVYGETDEAVVFGWAYARAKDRLHLIERHFIRGLGRLSEIDGMEAIYPKKGSIGSDYIVKAFDYLENAKQTYEQLEPKYKSICKAYTDGLNYYLSVHPEEKLILLEEFEPWMVIASDAWVATGGGLSQEMQWAPVIQASNSLAIGKSITKNGETLLMANPHMPFDFQSIEYHLISKEGLNIYGTSANGSGIFPTVGFNDFLGWTLTINTSPDLGDRFQIFFNHPTDSLKYEFDEGYKDATVKSVSFKIKQGDSISILEKDIIMSVYGPVFKLKNGRNVAFSIESGRSINYLKQSYSMAKSKNLQEFKQALNFNAFTRHNLTYADRNDIYFISNAYVPKRDTTFSWLGLMPGNTSKTLWKGFHNISELPQVENPSDGFVLNANSSPFVTTNVDNPKIEDYPDYMYNGYARWEHPLKDNSRTARMKMAIKQDSILDMTWMEDLVTDNLNTIFTLTERQDYTARWEKLIKNDPQRADSLKEPMNSLLSWNGRSDKNSVGATLFNITNSFVDEKSQSKTPKIDAFEEVIGLLKNEFNTWEVEWQEVVRHQRSATGEKVWDPDRPNYAVKGAFRGDGVMLGIYPESNPFNEKPKSLKRRATVGNAYVSVIEFSNDGPRARNILPYGNSINPNSIHYSDQAELFANGELRDVYFDLKDVESNLETKYKPGRETHP